LALKGARDRRRLIRDFSGSDRAVTDYLVEAVLNRLKPDMQEFLMVTALLDRMCVDLCREVTGRDDCQALLDRIEADNLFLLPLDREHKWYRYHHLFADFLRARITARHPKRVRRCCALASDWFARRGYDSEAIRYGFAAGDFERVADLIESGWEDLVQNRGEHATLLDWMRRLPETHIDARPRLRIAHAWSLTFTRRYAEAEQELKKLDASPERKTGLASTDPSALRAVEMIRCVLYALSDRTERCFSASNDWLRRWTDSPPFETGTVSSTLAYTCVARRDFEHVRAALQKARAAFEDCSGHYGIAWNDAMEGITLIQEGRPQEATTVYRRGLALAERELGSYSYAGSMLSVLLSEALYELDELDEAREQLDAGFALVDDHGAVETALAGYVTRARLLCHQDRCEDMDLGLVEGQHLGERLGLLRLSVSLAAERIALNLRCGGVDKAYSIAQASGFLAPQARQPWSAEPDMEAIRETVQFARARLWTATGEADRAVKTLGGLATRARKRGWNRRLIELLAARTIAYERCGNRKHAFRTLDAAVRLAASGGFVRVFLDAGPALGDLIEEMNESRPAVPGTSETVVRTVLARLTRSTSGATGTIIDPAAPASDETQGDALTRRETEILKLLAEGLSNQELAKTLFVSETTVKWHLSNVYAKLGVRNRTSAVGQARQRLLI
jgi:LuxR family maltose regulon positive regulatory protein